MNVNQVSGYQNNYQPPEVSQAEALLASANPGQAAAETGAPDIFEKSRETKESYKPDRATIQKMMRESEQKIEEFRLLLEKIFNKQGLTFEQAFGMFRKSIEDGTLEVDEATRKQAQEDIAEGGYWSVEKTAERIFDFAVALSGGDPSKIELLRDAVTKGYEMAKESWGGELPEISQKTYDEVMRRFDAWAAETADKSTVA